ncbi:zinc finger, CCHC-type containing protein [Tanacetum coccineum]|uniref:Zinc finger, CCHC-type containing protein n=1 Tax=Tanacetum coccineum TaxID=301880 RepID=A0ABQ5FAT7_9ASTR
MSLSHQIWIGIDQLEDTWPIANATLKPRLACEENVVSATRTKLPISHDVHLVMTSINCMSRIKDARLLIVFTLIWDLLSMVAAAMKHMASNFAKLDNMSVVYVLTTPIPDDGDDATVDQLRKRAKWDNDDYNVESFKELWDSLEAKYMAEDASSKKFLVSNFTNYKMTYSRPVLEQYNELLGILGRFTQYKMNMDESIQVSCIIDKLPPSWKDFKHTLKHLKEELTLIELGNHLRIKESLRMQDSDKPKGNNVVGPSFVNMVEHNNSSRYSDNKGKRKHHDNTKADPNKKSKVTCWKCGKPGHLKKDSKGGRVSNKANGSGTNGLVDGSTNSLKGQNMFNKSFQVPNIRKNLVSSSVLNNYVYKQVIESDKFVLSKHAFMSTSKLNDSILWHARLGHVHFKMMQGMSKDRLIPSFDMDIENDLCDMHATPSLRNKKYFVTFIDDASRTESRILRTVVRLPDPKLKTLGKKGLECIFVGYAKHSKAFRFYVIEPNDSVSINSIIESRDEIFDENRFSSVPRPSLKIPNGTEDIGGSVVPEEVTEEVVQQSKPELRKSKRNRTPKDFRLEFQLYLIEGTNDEISMASIHNLMDVKTAFLNGDLDEEQAPKQRRQKFDEVVLSNGYLLNQVDKCVYSKFDEYVLYEGHGEADVILGIRIKHGSNGIAISQSHYIEKVLKKFNYFDCTPVSTPMDTSEKLMPNNGQPVSQLEYSRVIGCLMYAMTCTMPDIAFVVDNSSTSGWVFLLGGGAILWASKKQTCITGSTMESEFVALVAAGKEAKWLKNLLLEIPLWSKPISPIYIRCNSAATLEKAYSQMYYRKSRHLGVRHSMIRELITNGVISIEFVSSYQVMGLKVQSVLPLVIEHPDSDSGKREFMSLMKFKGL